MRRPLERLRLVRRLGRVPARLILAGLVAVNSVIACGVLASLAMVFNTTRIFPSLGPAAFIMFARPTAPASSPRNAIVGHAVGIACGYGALWLTGLQDALPETVTGVTGPRIAAAALSLAGTGGGLVLLGMPHPPAAATTLMVSLGIVTTPVHLLILEVGVVALALQAIVVNRLAGVDYPLWAAPKGRDRPSG